MLIKKNINPIILIIITLNILFYMYNAYVNGSSVLTGINPMQRLNAGGMSQGYSLWRIFTSLFVHASLLHLAANMIVLYLLSLMIGSYLSYFKLALIYLFSGLIGNVIGLLLTPNTVMCGASTAIFGMLGTLIVKAIIERHNNPKQLILVAILSVYLMTITYIDDSTNNTLHFSGLVAGFIIVFILKIKVKISHET
ncbi:rhomboid family intramembrane serine protease [Staphylococcus pseudoxylosus]|uniref:rhomboid family intramembrane serine protease n=1 Tax=Staphylococcus pseudoxylosus TaxID=2282419 RepID=UPI001F2CE578|nr:rhomboid family intramembrane serine protease [Staphylococcus pseudoxylosus]MCE5003493.1 rhomboid family intramembrane serine protease [Staphylococcus pseudoxylosus]